MEKILNSILDIDPNDPTVRELDRLAKRFGIPDMAEVVREAAGLYGLRDHRIGFKLSLSTYQPIAKALIAAAIMNYAVSVHPEFFVDMPEQPEKKPRIYQTVDGNIHREYSDKYLRQAKDLIAQFEN